MGRDLSEKKRRKEERKRPETHLMGLVNLARKIPGIDCSGIRHYLDLDEGIAKLVLKPEDDEQPVYERYRNIFAFISSLKRRISDTRVSVNEGYVKSPEDSEEIKGYELEIRVVVDCTRHSKRHILKQTLLDLEKYVRQAHLV